MTKPNEIPSNDPWLDELNRLLAATADLGPAQWADRAQGLLRLVTPRPHGQLVAAALDRNQNVMDHLTTWSGTTHLQILVAQTGFAPDGSRRITVRKGTVWIECGDDPAAAVPATFDGWFKALTGRPFPIPGWGTELAPAGRNFWLPPGATRSDVSGFPRPLRVAKLTDYRLAVFDGHGCNSYAIYLTDVRPGLSLRLRLFFGGFYGNPEDDSARVVSPVAGLYRLVDDLKVRLTHFEYTLNIDRARSPRRCRRRVGRSGREPCGSRAAGARAGGWQDARATGRCRKSAAASDQMPATMLTRQFQTGRRSVIRSHRAPLRRYPGFSRRRLEDTKNDADL